MASGFLGGLTGGAIGSAVVRLVLDDSQYTRGLAEAKTETAAASAAMSTNMQKFNLATEAALGGVIAGFGVLTGAAINAAIEQERVLTQLKAVVGENTQAYEEQALALQRLTGASDEAILSADAILARFELTGEEIRAAIPIVLDYAQATGKDIPSAASAVGKALLGNSRALKEVGIEYTRTGDRSKDFADILDLLEDRVGGSAEAFGKTMAGQLQIANEEFDNLLETVGTEILPLFIDLIPVITNAAETITPYLSDAVGDAVDSLTGFAEIATTLYDAVTTLTDALGDLGVQAEVSGISIEGIVRAINPTAAEMLKWTGIIGENKSAMEEATQRQQDWIASTLDAKRTNIEEFMLEVAKSAGFLADETGELRDASDRAADAMREQAAAALELQSAQLELAGGVLGLIEAGNSYGEAQAEVNRLEAAGKQGTQAYADAVADLLSEKLALTGQAIDFKEQLLEENATLKEARAALREYGIEAGLSGEALRTFIQTGIQPARDELKQLNDEMDEFDGRNVSATLTLRTTVIGNTVEGYDPGLSQYATGGIIAGARGFITRKPTFLVGEGSYPTFAGRGAEAVVPLNERGIEILAEAVRRGTGGTNGGGVNVYGDVYGYDDFVSKVNDAMTSAILMGS